MAFLLQTAGMKASSTSNRKISDTISHTSRAPASSSSRDARAVRSGLALQEAMLALLERKPFEQITIRDICAEAGVHYATFFRHHQTKEALLDFIARDQIAKLNELTMAIRGSSDYAAGFRAMCEYVGDHRDLWSTLLNGGAGAAMREEWVRQSMRVAANEEPVNSWLPTDLGTICAATLIAETLAWWVSKPDGEIGVEEIARILMRLLASSIISPD